MKKVIVFLLICFVAMGCLLSGCGKSGAAKEDAQKYVGAVLDLMCKGEYDSSVDLSNLKEEEVSGFRDEMIDEMLESIVDDTGMDEDAQSRAKDYIGNAFSKCKYSVEDAVKTEDGGYDVTVSIEPLMLFAGVEEALQRELGNLTNDPEELLNMPEEELYGMIYDATFKVLNDNLENPTYAKAEKVTVHYGMIDEEDQTYGIDEEAGKILGEKLFSSDGLE